MTISLTVYVHPAPSYKGSCIRVERNLFERKKGQMEKKKTKNYRRIDWQVQDTISHLGAVRKSKAQRKKRKIPERPPQGSYNTRQGKIGGHFGFGPALKKKINQTTTQRTEDRQTGRAT